MKVIEASPDDLSDMDCNTAMSVVQLGVGGLLEAQRQI